MSQEGHAYCDGCHVWICFPGVQRLRYHPFSVASCSGDPAWKHHLLVQTKVFDKWTKVRRVHMRTAPEIPATTR